MDPHHRLAAPLYQELKPPPDPVDVFRSLCGRRHCLFLDSALRDSPADAAPGRVAGADAFRAAMPVGAGVGGRYSFVMADPFAWVECPADARDGLARLEAQVRPLRAAAVAGLPPFQGGAAGLFSYDLGRSLERLPGPRQDEFELPALAVGLYDVVVAVDHRLRRAWIISQGLPETEPARRRQRAAERLEQFRRWISEPRQAEARPPSTGSGADELAAAELGRSFPTAAAAGLLSNFSAAGYRHAVRQVIDYIHAGDVFQVNLSQRLLYRANDHAVQLYQRLRQHNPAPFAAYFDLGPFQICSTSPERFLRVANRQVEARPIKGTRPRLARPEADLFSAADLRQSEKDRAENVMIVDLVRNDLARVCTPESVRVAELCSLETYAFVQHLVSVVQGRLADGRSPLDLLRASFPGGSVTGAPKIRAMQIIAELEPNARGAYCGSLGYLGFDGSLDSSILIRTVTAGRGWWQLPVGGGIVAQSVPEREYAETWHKAEGMLRALTVG